MAKTVVIQGQQKWEYCFESRRTDNALLTVLTDLGQRGWELVNVMHHKDPKGETSWTAFLKRPSVGPGPSASPSGQSTATLAVPAPTGQAEDKGGALQGFDLSGDEFQLKSD
jgi:hypothetical protein